MRKFLLLAISLMCIAVSGQDIKPSMLVKERKSETTFEKFNLFALKGDAREELPTELNEFAVMTLNAEVRRNILQSPHHELSLTIPLSERKTLELDLVEITFQDLVVRTSEKNSALKFKAGRHYRGIIKGDDKSVVAISIFEEDVMGMISTQLEEGNLVLGALNGSKSNFILYRDSKINQHMTGSCGVTETGIKYDAHELALTNGDRAFLIVSGYIMKWMTT